MQEDGASIAPGAHPKSFAHYVMELCQKKYVDEWTKDLHNDTRKVLGARNKLRTYRLFKTSFEPEAYLTGFLNIKYKRAFAMFRCGVAPLRVELDRCTKGVRIPYHERVCELCDLNMVENEEHVLCHCPVYANIRNNLYGAVAVTNPDFKNINETAKFVFLMSSSLAYKRTASACYDILNKRNDIIYMNINANNVFTNVHNDDNLLKTLIGQSDRLPR